MPATLPRLCQLREGLLEGGHVPVRVAVPLGLAEANAVDDGGMIERIGDHRILFTQYIKDRLGDRQDLLDKVRATSIIKGILTRLGVP